MYMYVYAFVYVCTCMCVHLCMCVHVCVCVYVLCMHVCICVCACVFIYDHCSPFPLATQSTSKLIRATLHIGMVCQTIANKPVQPGKEAELTRDNISCRIIYAANGENHSLYA